MVNERSMVKYFVQVLEIEDILRLWGLMPSGQIDKRATQKHTFERAWRMTEGPDGINDSIGCRQTKMWIAHALKTSSTLIFPQCVHVVICVLDMKIMQTQASFNLNILEQPWLVN
jgi:hypothetical protein